MVPRDPRPGPHASDGLVLTCIVWQDMVWHDARGSSLVTGLYVLRTKREVPRAARTCAMGDVSWCQPECRLSTDEVSRSLSLAGLRRGLSLVPVRHSRQWQVLVSTAAGGRRNWRRARELGVVPDRSRCCPPATVWTAQCLSKS